MQVRGARREDAPAIAAIYRHYVERTAVSFEDVAPEATQLLARMRAAPRLPWLVAQDDVEGVVGYAYAAAHRDRAAYRWAVDCSVYLAPGHTGRGTGRLLYDALLPVLRDLGYWRVHAGIALPNAVSVRLHDAVGFVPVGVYRAVGYKLGRWHDVGWWQLALVDGSVASAPEPPRPWPGAVLL